MCDSNFLPSAGLSYWKIGTRQICMKWLLIIRHVNSVKLCQTVSTVSTVSTVIARCYLHLRWYFLSDCQVFRGCQSCKIGCQRSQKLFARLIQRCVKNLHIDEYRWGFEDWAKQYWPNGARQCNGAIGKLSWIAPRDGSWCWIYVYSFTQRRTELWSYKCWLVNIQSVYWVMSRAPWECLWRGV